MEWNEVENHMVQPHPAPDYQDDNRTPQELEEDAWEDFKHTFSKDFKYLRSHIKDKSVVFEDVDDIEAIWNAIDELLSASKPWGYEGNDYNLFADAKDLIESL